MEKKGIEALKKIASELDAAIELGIEIGKGGVGKEDVVHIPAIVERVKAIVALIPELKEAEEELKDIDLSEGIELAIHAAKEIQD
jgi:C4-type Zn-finger protein